MRRKRDGCSMGCVGAARFGRLGVRAGRARALLHKPMRHARLKSTSVRRSDVRVQTRYVCRVSRRCRRPGQFRYRLYQEAQPRGGHRVNYCKRKICHLRSAHIPAHFSHSPRRVPAERAVAATAAYP